MPKNPAVTIETDLPAALPLRRSELDVLFKWEGILLRHYIDRWVGWKYDGRPVSAPRLVSHDAWQGIVETRTEHPEIVISNEARGWRSGKPYVSEIRRKKGARPEWEVVTDEAINLYLNDMTNDLADALIDAISSGRKRKSRTTGGPALSMELVV